jgi:hypothetical protein
VVVEAQGEQGVWRRLSLPALILLLAGVIGWSAWSMAAQDARRPAQAMERFDLAVAAERLRGHLAEPARVLDRRDLVTFARLVAASPGAGSAWARAAIGGRRFRVEAPLGCGPVQTAQPTTSASWWYDFNGGAIRMKAQPDPWTSPSMSPPSAAPLTKVFWITRPRQAARDCPPGLVADIVSALPSDDRRIGLAGAARLQQVAADYGARLAATPRDLARIVPRLRFVVEGVVDANIPDCRAAGAGKPQDCAIPSRIEQVAFTDGSAPIVRWSLAG